MKSNHSKGNPFVIPVTASVVVALIFSIIPLPLLAFNYRPPFVALVILFWAIYFPKRSGMGLALIVGLVFDQLMGSDLGQHTLALILIAGLMRAMSHQMRLFSIWQQIVVIFAFLLLYQLVFLVCQGLLGAATSMMWFWVPAVTGALFWPWVAYSLNNKHRIALLREES